jgi:hypothetical protein
MFRVPLLSRRSREAGAESVASRERYFTAWQRRAAAFALCLAIVAAAWLEFRVFPGHTYLEGDTQLYVPMLERVDAPGLLARDLVAANPNLSLTAYDEVTVFLHKEGRLTFRRALLGQQFLFRIAALSGVFLLARSTGLSDLFAFLLAAIVNLGATLAGPLAFLAEREPLPSAFAFSLTLLAMGFLAVQKPLLAGLACGISFLYDPVLALPFWLVLLAGFCFDREMRVLARPMLPIFLVFALLLANLAQLQPAAGGEPPFARLSWQEAAFQRAQTPYLYVSLWSAGDVYQFLALYVFAFWAAVRVWPLLPRRFLWLVLGAGLCGLLSIPLSYLLLDQNHLAWAARLRLPQTLLFTALAGATLFGLAGMRAILHHHTWEALGWFTLLFALPVSTGLFDILRIVNVERASQFAIACGLAALLAGLLLGFATGPARFLTLAAPVLAIFALAQVPGLHSPPIPFRQSVGNLAAWADGSTWGSSIFLFADADKATYPGVFRAQSRHGLWVDWKSREGVAYSETAAMRWQERWQRAMKDGFSPSRLESILPLPIDYYVLKRQNQLIGVRYAFVNQDFVVYDAQDLRNAAKPLPVNH